MQITYKKILIEKINYYIVLLLAFWLPLYKPAIPYIIAALLVSWILEGGFKQKFSNVKWNKNLIIFILFYLIHLIGLLYSKNFNSGLFDVQLKLSLIIFPVFFVTSNNLIRNNWKKILISFIIGCLISSLICLSNAFYKSIFIHNNSIIFEPVINGYNNFCFILMSIFHNPTYYSMYLVFSIIIIISYFINKKIRPEKKYQYFLIFVFCVLIIMIYLSSSRAGIINAFIVLFSSLIIYLIRYKNYLKSILLFICIVLFANYSIINNSRLKFLPNKIVNNTNIIINEIKSKPDKDINIAIVDSINNANFPNIKISNKKKDVRLLIWDVSVNLIKNNFFTGVGTGDVKDELILMYQNYEVGLAEKNDLNCHNQYLETFVRLGVIGFILLLLILILPFIRAIKEKNYINLFFLIIISIHFIFESMLNTLAGVVFFSFFYSLLILLPQQNKLK
ncbi:MAG: O-antigen ligase family protein [Bacteroidales bacterium]|nr:O-antigen ligase family protein [Bacteroidales bacterium]